MKKYEAHMFDIEAGIVDGDNIGVRFTKRFSWARANRTLLYDFGYSYCNAMFKLDQETEKHNGTLDRSLEEAEAQLAKLHEEIKELGYLFK